MSLTDNMRTLSDYKCVREVHNQPKDHNPCPWNYLDAYRGRLFNGLWPSLPEQFTITTERFPKRPAYECFLPAHVIYDYEQSYNYITSIARYLVDNGVKKGDRIAVSGKNSPEWCFAYLATMYAGAVVCPVDNALTPEEAANLMNYAEVKFVFADSDKLAKLNVNGIADEQKISLEDMGDYKYALTLDGQSGLPEVTDTDTAAILFTSGTTGNPKGVVLSQRNIVSDTYLAQNKMNIDENDAFYAVLPIHHAYTMVALFTQTLSSGGKLVIGKKPIVSQITKELTESGANVILAVPMVFNKFMSGIMKKIEAEKPFKRKLVLSLMKLSGNLKKKHNINIGKKLFGKMILDKIGFSNIRICISGGGPLPAETADRFNQLGINFVQGYGMTETSPIISLCPLFDFDINSVGQVFEMTEYKVIDKDSEGNGILCFRGPQVMQGYYKNPEATAQVIDEDGFINTGDVGHIDDRGFIYLTGRAKNIIVTEGGKNVFPEEIEDKFQLYFDFEQICCIGFSHSAEKLAGEQVCAIVYPSAECRGKYTDPDALYAHLMEIIETVNKELLPYQRIRKLVIAEKPLEMTTTSKVKRFVVAKQYKEQINNDK